MADLPPVKDPHVGLRLSVQSADPEVLKAASPILAAAAKGLAAQGIDCELLVTTLLTPRQE